jgi:mannose-1-phosphate guanylyltransferase
VFTGVHVMGPEAQALLPSSGCLVRETFFAMLDRGMPIAGFLHEGYWNDIGTPAEYLGANLDILCGRAGALLPPRPVEDGHLVGVGVSMGDARLGPGVIVGDGARIGHGARLERCVLWEGASVEGRIVDAICSRSHVVTVAPSGA